MRRLDVAVLGWLGVTAVVVGYDAWALLTGRTTLSRAFHAANRHPVAGWVVKTSWLGLTWHLMGNGRRLLPEKHHSLYARIHPLWVVHDRLVARQGNSIVVLPVDEVVESVDKS